MGRWLSVDPLADKYPGISPYAYCFNNPLNFIDPTGMEGVGSTITYDDETRTHTITSSESKVQSGQSIINDDGTITTTETIVTTTTTAMVKDGKFVDGNGNEVNSITQTTKTKTITYTSSLSSVYPTLNSQSASTTTSMVSPTSNRLASAVAGWQQAGNVGTPFNTTQDYLDLAGDVSNMTGLGSSIISNFPRRISIAGTIVGAGATVLGLILDNTNSINNRHFFDDNVSGNVLHPLNKYYKK